MNMELVIGYARGVLKNTISPQNGKSFEKKPEGYDTFQKWLDKGYRPKESSLCKGRVFAIGDGPMGYTYFNREDVEPLTADECKQLDGMGVKHGVVKAEGDRVFGSAKEGHQMKVDLTRKQPKRKLFSRGYPSNNTIERLSTGASMAGVKTLSKFPGIEKSMGKKVYTVNVATNGTDVKNDDVIYVTIVGLNEKGDNDVLFNQKVRPINNEVWSEEEQKKCGFTPRDLAGAPYPIHMADYLRKFFASADYVSTYDAKFNIAFLEKTFGFKIPREKILDSKEIFKENFPGESSYKMGAAVRKYIPHGIKAYGASNSEEVSEKTINDDTKIMHALFYAEREKLLMDAMGRQQGMEESVDDRER